MSRSSDSHSNDDETLSVCSSDINNNDLFSDANSYTAEHRKKSTIQLNPHIHVLQWKRRNGKRWKTHKITLYGTPNLPKASIVHAETGKRYAYQVGTLDEELFFSTILATGECGKHQPPLLFYDTPEQYEAHLMLEVPAEIKRAWYVRYYQLLADRERKQKTMLTLSGRKPDGTISNSR